MASSRTLTVFCRAGLSNRVRVLISGIAVAEVSSRAFRMIWPRNASCGASFRDLFANDWPVADVDKLDPALAAHQSARWSFRTAHGLLSDPRRDIVLGLNNWLVNPEPGALPVIRARCIELLDELEPRAILRDRITGFRADHFRPPVIGVHLRRGDFLRLRPDVAGNTQEALAALDCFLAEAPHARIFLCTDDGSRDQKQEHREGLRELFQARYGDRMIATSPRSLDRRTPEGVQDAVVDLWLLRATQMLVGTHGSSFSALAVFGRDVPHKMVGGALGSYRRFDWIGRVTGVQWFVRKVFRLLYGYDRPFPQAWSRLVLIPLRRARKRRRERRGSP
jgi:hypothetical protein